MRSGMTPPAGGVEHIRQKARLRPNLFLVMSRCLPVGKRRSRAAGKKRGGVERPLQQTPPFTMRRMAASASPDEGMGPNASRSRCRKRILRSRSAPLMVRTAAVQSLTSVRFQGLVAGANSAAYTTMKHAADRPDRPAWLAIRAA